MSATEQIINEFPPVTPEKWAELFLKETKQENIQAHSSYLGFEFLPYYTAQKDYGVQAALLQSLAADRSERWYVNRHIYINNIGAANKAILDALSKGVSSLTLVGDLHSDEEAEMLLKDVKAEYIEINFQCNDAVTTATHYYNWCAQQGIAKEKLFGAVYDDPITEALRNGGWKKEKALEKLVALYDLSKKNAVQQVKAITIDATVYHYAGAGLAQTIALALAHAVEYFDHFKSIGYDLDEVAERFVFKWPVGTSFFAEVAALRALRLGWNNLCRHITGKDKVYKVFVQAQTSVHFWSVADMYNNMLRATTQAMSAVAGGANTVYVLPYNVVSTAANDFSERMAVNVQLLLREESFLSKVTDPAAGSYLVEELTHQLVQKALNLLKACESKGGLLQQAYKGELQKGLSANMARITEALLKGEIKVLGANLYPNKNEDLSAVPHNDIFAFKPSGKDFAPLELKRLAAVIEKK